MAETEWHQWQSPAGRQTERWPRPQTRETGLPPRPYVPEDTLKDDFVWIERKTFTVALKENPRGRFVRITEGASGRRNTIIVPATGLKEFLHALDEMVKASNEISPKNAPAAAPEEQSTQGK